MKYKKNNCSGCNEERYIVKSFYNLCDVCNKKRLEDKKESKPKKGLKKTPRKATGERDLFFAIWTVRPHVCDNCNIYLGEEPKVHYFAHIKSKGAHPELRLKPSNIALLCMDCHTAYDHQGIDKFKSRSHGTTKSKFLDKFQ